VFLVIIYVVVIFRKEIKAFFSRKRITKAPTNRHLLGKALSPSITTRERVRTPTRKRVVW